jgi:uncharacterized surface protein with fasciclin (FAS1) repeats
MTTLRSSWVAYFMGAFLLSSAMACGSDDTSTPAAESGGSGGTSTAGSGGAAGSQAEGGSGGTSTAGSGGTSTAGSAGSGGTSEGVGGAAGAAAGSAGAGGASAGAAGSGDAGAGGSAPTQSIVEIAAGNPAFSTLVDLVTSAGLATALSGAGPFTVFAPTNDAFAKFLADNNLTADDLKKPENKQILTDILTYHVSTDASAASPATTGVYSPEVVGKADINTLLGATQKTSFLDVALVKDASDPTKITSVLVGLGAPLPFQGTIATPDVGATNGVIHVIDRVLLPPKYVGFGTGIALDLTASKNNVIDLVTFASTVGFADSTGTTTPEFTTLVALAAKCGLVDALKAAKDITVFAPTDAAFKAANIDSSIDCAAATPVLQYHVVPAVAPASAAIAAAGSGGKVPTLLTGKELGFKLDAAKGLLVDDGSAAPPAVVLKNVQTENAIVHVIDGVLMPK